MKKEHMHLLMLHVVLAVYSTCGIFSKLAGKETFLSFQFCLYYALMILMLGIYAIVWQKVIAVMPLTTAFANKAVTIVWGIIWGCVFFHESITIGKIIGAALVVGGVVMFALSDKEVHDDGE